MRLRAAGLPLAGLLVGLAALTGPGRAQEFDASGYVLGCGEGGCMVFAQGFALHVADDGATPGRIIALMDRMEPMTAVDLAGELGPPGDGLTELRLSRLTARPEDPFQQGLRRIQGVWKPAQAEISSDSAMELQINGLIWQENHFGEPGLAAMISPRESCLGLPPGEAPGLALALVPLGGDGGETACWQVEEVSETEMTLRDSSGAQGGVVMRRSAE